MIPVLTEPDIVRDLLAERLNMLVHKGEPVCVEPGDYVVDVEGFTSVREVVRGDVVVQGHTLHWLAILSGMTRNYKRGVWECEYAVTRWNDE